MNAQGVDIRARPCISVEINLSGNVALDASDSPPSYQARHSTRVECVELKHGVYDCGIVYSQIGCR